ncbi:MAG TPA: phage portal protein [Arthrobacter sp.]|nr:phage portal protein [Arthrobacter sp.]
MALPQTSLSWPPTQLTGILPSMGVWSAWYSGDTDQLSSVYGGATGSDPSATGFFASDHGGFRATVGRALTRWFWGEASRGPDRRVKLHVPIAAEICQASADLLFSDTVTITSDDKDAQDRLDELCTDHFHAELVSAAEVCAALGGVYLRVAWDSKTRDAPFLTHVDADQAIPEFTWGTMTAVTFWQVVARDGKRVYRHLERHETLADGTGVILHGLYEGEEDRLGHPIPLTEQPATAPLATVVDAFGMISSESDGLCVVYVPNQTPNRRWRTHSLGRNLGRSDLDGVEQLMDALDETMTSWMRDVRLGKARLMVAKSLLNNVGPGQGSAFNAEQEAYASMNMLSPGEAKLSDLIEQVQFNIRVAEHQDTASHLVMNILQMAGYSAETFGIYEGGGSTKTATEVEAKQQRSLLTRDRKWRLWRPALQDALGKLLAVDRALFNGNTVPDGVDIDCAIAEGVQESLLTLSQTIQALRAADAASDEVIQGMLHPDWDEEQIQEEIRLIREQKRANALPDPMFMGGTPDIPPVAQGGGGLGKQNEKLHDQLGKKPQHGPGGLFM